MTPSWIAAIVAGIAGVAGCCDDHDHDHGGDRGEPPAAQPSADVDVPPEPDIRIAFDRVFPRGHRADGIRERRQGVTVVTRGDEDHVVDDAGRELVEWPAVFLDLEPNHVRMVRIAAVTDRYLAVLVGDDWMDEGAAHAHQQAACIAFDRASGTTAAIDGTTEWTIDPDHPDRRYTCAWNDIQGELELFELRDPPSFP